MNGALPNLRGITNPGLKHRINAGRVAVSGQVGFFRKLFGQVQSEWKEDDTRVTFADFAISENILSELRRMFPKDEFCSEESIAQDEELKLGSRFGWILDPIDGTNNYALGIPLCGISLALLHDGAPVYGFVYDMARDVLIQGGATNKVYDGRRAALVRHGPFHSQSMVGLHFPLSKEEAKRLGPLMAGSKVRSLGCCSLNLAYCAVGLLDGCVDFRVKIWDIAAAYTLLRAAGGEVHFLNGSPFPLDSFHLSMAPTPFYAGSKEFCSYVRNSLELNADEG